MEFFRIICPARAEVFIDGNLVGENLEDGEPKVFMCNAGVHDISVQCLDGRQCQEPVQKIRIEHTNPILPLEVVFLCP